MNNEDVSKYLKKLKEIKKPPSKWTVDEMIENLSKCQLNFFRKNFKVNEIDGKKFLKMKEFDTFLSGSSDCEEILNYQIALQTIEKKNELQTNDDDITLKYNKKKKNQTDSDEEEEQQENIKLKRKVIKDNDSKSKFKKNKKKITDSDEEEEEEEEEGEEEEINQKKPMDKNKEGKTIIKNRKKIPSKEESDDSEKNPKPILKKKENNRNIKKNYIDSEEEENIKLEKNIIKGDNIASKRHKNKKNKTDSEEEEYKNSEEEEQNEDSEENNIKDLKKKKNSQSLRSSSSQSSQNEKSKKNNSSKEENIEKKKNVTIDDDLKSKLQKNIKKKTDFEEAEENSTKLRESIKKKNMSITLNKKGKKNSDEENDSSHSSQRVQHVRNSSSSQEELKEEIIKTKKAIKKEIKDSSDYDSNNENPENIDNDKGTKFDRQIQNIEDQATQSKEKKKILLTLEDQDKKKSIEIETSCKIGSSLDGNFRITSVTSKKISVNYADIIFINNGNYLIKDDKSPNGLFISLVPGTEIKLSNNMCFKVGSTFFKIINIEKNLLKIGVATNQNFNDMQIKSSEFGEKQKIVLGKNPAKLPSFKFIDFPNDDNFEDIHGLIYYGDVENMFLLNVFPSKKGVWFKLQKTDNNSEYPFVKLFPRIKIQFSDKNIYTVKNVNVVDLKLCSKCQKTAKSIYLPCLHSVYCFDCAKNERNCEECNKKIKSVEEIIDFTYN